MEEEEEVNAKISSSPERHEDDDNEKPIGVRRQRQLLSNLLSELESMEEKVNNVTEEETNTEDTVVCSETMNSKKEVGNEEIIKELKNVKRQNTTTHCLVSAMIVLTLAWQLSDISLILKIKDGLSNPLKYIRGFFKNRRQVSNNNVQDVVIKQAVSEKEKQVIGLPGLKIPELPHLGLPGFDDN